MASIKDVAALAGVSLSTVSAVVNGLDCVKDSTRQKVLNAIEVLGYTPNRSARELVTKRKQNIGFIAMVSEDYEKRIGTFDVGSDMFYVDYFQALSKEFSDSDFGLLYENYCFDPDHPVLPKMIRQNRVDSIFVLGGINTEAFLQTVRPLVPNIIVLGSNPEHCLSVHNDYYASVLDCIRYFTTRGHRKIAIVHGEKTAAYALKHRAYQDALKEAKIPYRDQLVFHAKYTASAGYESAKQICGLPADLTPTAVFFACDILAAGAYRFFAEHGIRIPDDLSVIGYENLILSEFLSPGLTSVDFQKEEIASAAADMMKTLQKGRTSLSSAVIPYRMIERGSVRSI